MKCTFDTLNCGKRTSFFMWITTGQSIFFVGWTRYLCISTAWLSACTHVRNTHVIIRRLYTFHLFISFITCKIHSQIPTHSNIANKLLRLVMLLNYFWSFFWQHFQRCSRPTIKSTLVIIKQRVLAKRKPCKLLSISGNKITFNKTALRVKGHLINNTLTWQRLQLSNKDKLTHQHTHHASQLSNDWD